ncbi:MAG: TIGR00268 family protein, partial [Thermodesulfobacteriota bacterium]
AGSMLLDHLQIEPERLLEVELQPLDWPEFVINDGARCYVCKKRMYQHFLTVLEGKNISVLLDGSNVDDLKSHRPGSRAIEELGVKTPLLDAGLTKKDIRALASVFQLANHAKPSNSCLATRFPEGSPVTREGLELVAQCESFLLSRGFSGCRVRPGSKKDVVLQVTAEDMGRLLETFERQEIIDYFSNVGFEKVLIDLRVRSL